MMETESRNKGQRLQVNHTASTDAFHVEPENHHWLRVSWVLTPATHDRAVKGLGPDWHLAKPVLRVNRVQGGESGPQAKQQHQDVLIPPDCPQWFINVPPGEAYWQVELGYLTKEGRFFSLMHSSPVATPHVPNQVRNANRTDELHLNSLEDGEELQLSIDTEMIITGRVTSNSIVSVDDVNIEVDTRSGQFQWRTQLVNGRFVVPIEAVNDRERQRILIAIEANTHYLDAEPLPRK